jgi:hypothetical protein
MAAKANGTSSYSPQCTVTRNLHVMNPTIEQTTVPRGRSSTVFFLRRANKIENAQIGSPNAANSKEFANPTTFEATRTMNAT